ncbi:MAG: 3-oxoacyl-ACP reductase FabG [bacterium]|nr:3-oxoacyl-ACP reductase FabG [bacterium]
MEDRVLLVTGSSRGIGAYLCKSFAQKGFRVVINYSKLEEKAEEVFKEIVSNVGIDKALRVKLDVSDRKSVKDMFNMIFDKFGRIDILINNAGINIDKPFLEITDEDWKRVLDINLTGTFICSQEFALRYSESDGHIINIGASTALRGRKNGANYCSAKAGVIALTKCMALELAPRIKVNCIIPGFIETEKVINRYRLDQKENYENIVNTIPLKRLGNPEDVFKMAYFLVTSASYITGQNFFVNGGNYMG